MANKKKVPGLKPIENELTKSGYARANAEIGGCKKGDFIKIKMVGLPVTGPLEILKGVIVSGDKIGTEIVASTADVICVKAEDVPKAVKAE